MINTRRNCSLTYDLSECFFSIRPLYDYTYTGKVKQKAKDSDDEEEDDEEVKFIR